MVRRGEKISAWGQESAMRSTLFLEPRALDVTPATTPISAVLD